MTTEHQNEHEASKPKLFSIHIDKQEFKSPSPTAGEALYVLGGIDPAQYDLWKEVKGKGDDELIENTSTAVVVENGDHFYSAQKNLNPGA